MGFSFEWRLWWGFRKALWALGVPIALLESATGSSSEEGILRRDVPGIMRGRLCQLDKVLIAPFGGPKP